MTDATEDERRLWLADRRGVAVRRATVTQMRLRLGLTRKKIPADERQPRRSRRAHRSR